MRAGSGRRAWQRGVGDLTHLLYSKGIRSLGVQIGSIFVFLGTTTKEAEATRGAGEGFIGLIARGVRDVVSYARLSSLPS